MELSIFFIFILIRFFLILLDIILANNLELKIFLNPFYQQMLLFILILFKMKYYSKLINLFHILNLHSETLYYH